MLSKMPTRKQKKKCICQQIPELQLLLYTMQKTLESTVVSFLSVEQKKTILEKFWPRLVLLNIPNYQQISFENEAVRFFREIYTSCIF
jgi:hypothetical protein